MLVMLVLLMTGCTLRVASEILAYQDYATWAWTILPVSALIELTAVALFAINLTATFTFTGGLNGAFVAPFSILHLGACDQPAPEVFKARGTYTGSVAGVAGV